MFNKPVLHICIGSVCHQLLFKCFRLGGYEQNLWICREANKFLADQNETSVSTQKTQEQSHLDKVNVPMPIEKLMIKNICDLLQTELEEVFESLICGPRKKEQVNVSEKVLAQLCQLTGEECSLASPSSGVQRVLVFLADQIGVWAVKTVDEADQAAVEKRRKELYGEDASGKKDYGDDNDDDEDSDEKSRKGKRVKKNQNEIGHGDASKIKSGQPAGSSRNDPKTSKAIGDRRSPDGKKQPDTPKNGETKQKQKVDEMKKPSAQSPTGERSKGKSDGKTKAESGDKKPARPSSQSSAIKKPSTIAENKSLNRKKSSIPGTRISVLKRPSTGGLPGTLKKESKARPSTASGGRGLSGRKNVRPSTQEASRPKTSSEIRKKTMEDMLGAYLTKVISEAEPFTKNSRQEALQEVIGGKLRDALRPRDGETREAIKAASVTVSRFIDKLATTVDLEYGLRGQLPPKTGTIFSVKRANNEYAVSPLSFKDSRIKIYKARGLTSQGNLHKSEWTSWTDDAADLADQWAKWLDKTVTGAVAAAEKRKAGEAIDMKEWKDWKSATETEALEWRNSKKQLYAQADLMKRKMMP